MRKLFVFALLVGMAQAATQLVYTENITIKNNDYGTCTTNSFSLATTMPTGWKISYAQNPVTILPQQSSNVSAVITVPAKTKPGSYPVTITVTHNHKYSGTANVTVQVF